MADPYVLHDIDYATLPAAMLDVTKKHLRVDFTDDDEYIKLCLARAISLFEMKTDQRVFAAQADWTPMPETDATIAICPVQPVSSFTAKDADGNDVSTDYLVSPTGSATAPVVFASDDGTAIPAGLDVVLTVGFTDVADMPPVLTDSVLRITGMLYELRESVTTQIMQVPSWWDDLLVGQWIPRV